MQSSFDAAVKNTRIRVMPNSLLPPSMNETKGLILIGDAMNMRHPLTGGSSLILLHFYHSLSTSLGGMTVALWDVVFLSELLSPANIINYSDVDKTLFLSQKLHWKRKQISSSINILAKALYTLMATKKGNYKREPMLKKLKLVCFLDPAREVLLDGLTKYLSMGGIFSDHPAGLVSGYVVEPD
jgi:squalene monooxygenase